MSDLPPKKTPKWLDPNSDRAKRSNRHERRLATRLGGKRLPASGGRLWSRDGNDKVKTEGADIAAPDFLFEHKRTDKKSMAIQLAWLLKVAEAASRTSKDPSLVITFEVNKRIAAEWVAMPIDVFERLRKKAADD